MALAKKQKPDSKNSKTKICDEKNVKEAINVLKLLNKKFIENELKKQPLLEDATECPIYLQLLLKKIPPPQLLRMIRVPLPHSLITETSEVCLITGDLEKRNHKAEIEPTILHYKDLLRKHGITRVAQVIPLRQLRTEYKTFESKRQLAAAYDVFLVDKKVAGVLAKTLGKSFFQTRKFPIQIDMKRPNLKDQINKALHQTEFSLTCRGNSYALEIARLSMKDEAVVENIMATIEILKDKLPGKENNILSLYLKTAKSKAIPIYVSLDISQNITIKKQRKKGILGQGELSTIDNTDVKVFRDGRIILKKRDVLSENEDAQESSSNGVETTDNNELEDEEITQDSTSNISSKKSKKSKRSADVIEELPIVKLENEENTQDSVADKSSPKKKKARKSLNQVDANSHIDGEDTEITTERSSKKRKSKNAVDPILDDMEFKTDDQNSVSYKASPKKKSKNKIEENDNVKTPKSKGKNKAKNVINTEENEISSMSLEDTRITHIEKTPSRSKKVKKESSEVLDVQLMSSVSKRKKANPNSAVKASKQQKKH